MANVGSLPEAQCYKDSMKEISQVLATAFAPSHEDQLIHYGSYGNIHQSMNIEPLQTEQENNLQPPEAELINVDHLLAIWPHSTTITLETYEQTGPEQMAEELRIANVEAKRQEKNQTVAKWVVETQDAMEQDADEQPNSASGQSTGKTSETSDTVTQAADDLKKLSDSKSVAEAAAQRVDTNEKPNPSPTIQAIRSLYLSLIYKDRLTLFNNTTFLLFLAEQPLLSHSFFRFLIDYPFGFEYLDRYGSNANHGLTPFPVPFLPVRRDLPLELYCDNFWALLNDPAWLWWVSTEERIMASFWAEMSSRGGIGAMQRRKESAEGASKFDMAPF